MNNNNQVMPEQPRFSVRMSPPWDKNQTGQPESIRRYNLMPIADADSSTGESRKEVDANA